MEIEGLKKGVGGVAIITPSDDNKLILRQVGDVFCKKLGVIIRSREKIKYKGMPGYTEMV